MNQVRVAIADDSAFIRKALVRILEADSRLEVVGTASCGEELLDHLPTWKPDVISLDLSMPGIGGLRTLDRIMEQQPTPVIILSTHAREDAPLTIEALHRGAVDFIDKQRYSLVDFQSLSRILIDRILEISSRREALPPPQDQRHASEPAPSEEVASKTEVASQAAEPAAAPTHDLLVIAASTGGPMAIQTVLDSLGPKPPVPVVVIQHMPPDFTAAFADRLNNHLPFAVRHAADGEPLRPGTAYVAPGGSQFRFAIGSSGLVAALTEGHSGRKHSPSADVAFSSAAAALGSRVLAAILTGMGTDGAEGLSELAGLGAYAVAQDRTSSIVFGMPRAAVERGAVAEVLALEDIGPRLAEILRVG
ncbi:MAG: chemotaxis-specific protein-glutamate methyltransferase CheB [Thermoanaerobaculia bacterium]